MRKLDKQLSASRTFTEFPLDSVVEHIYQPLTSLFFLGFFVWGLQIHDIEVWSAHQSCSQMVVLSMYNQLYHYPVLVYVTDEEVHDRGSELGGPFSAGPYHPESITPFLLMYVEEAYLA